MDEDIKRNRRKKENMYIFFCMKFNSDTVQVHAME